MKRGFVTETHVVVYCESCGNHYAEGENEAVCFDTIAQAITHLDLQAAGVGWLFDGNTVVCDGCRATNYCIEFGHTFSTTLPLSTTRSRTCDRCGLPEIEAQK
ncbi:hypothetical protein AB0H49_16205 [Nocardia sp. NPDC050713]|uniref:hypothetical protein n=1 Tax=Nocardia sp. NPDC050713 TaxID=3154511 RepID=UPI0033F38477